MSSLIALFMHLAFRTDFHFQPVGQRIDHRSAHAMQAAGYLVSPTAEFSAGMKNRKYHFHSRYTRLVVDPHRNSSSVILHGDRIILIDRNINRGQRLVNRVIHNLIHQMMKSSQ